MRAVGVLGLSGGRASTSALARWLLLQSAILHSPGDLVIAAALPSGSEREWSWLKWLPHLRLDRVGLQVGAVAIGRKDAEKLLTEVRELVVGRRSHGRGIGDGPAQLLLLIDEDTQVDRSLGEFRTFRCGRIRHIGYLAGA